MVLRKYGTYYLGSMVLGKYGTILSNFPSFPAVLITLKGYTLLIAEILSGKNVRAWVSMDFT